MAGGHDDSTGGASEHLFGDERPWRHPSEVGLAARGQVDRRRSSYVAAGVLISGIGLLVSGVLMGHLAWPSSEVTPAASAERRTEHAVASVSRVDERGLTVATAVVLDDAGHLVLDAAALDAATPLEPRERLSVRCADGERRSAEVLGTDAETGLAVLRMSEPGGSPAVLAHRSPGPDAPLELLAASRRGTERSSATLAPRSAVFASLGLGPVSQGPTLALDGSADAAGGAAMVGAAVFEADGRLVGLVDGQTSLQRSGTVSILPAAVIMDAAVRVMSSDGD